MFFLKLEPPLFFTSHLQYDPVALLGSLLHGELSHSLLALAQRHVVELPQVDGESQLPPWETRVQRLGGTATCVLYAHLKS